MGNRCSQELIYRLCVLAAVSAVAAGCGGSSPGNPSTPSSPGLNFQGEYAGTYTVTNCASTGTDICQAVAAAGFVVGRTLPIALTLNQNQTAVTGAIALGLEQGSFAGTVQPAGDLRGTATLTPLTIVNGTIFGPVTTTVPVQVNNWDTTIAGNNLVGGFQLAIGTTVTGIAYMGILLQRVSRQ